MLSKRNITSHSFNVTTALIGFALVFTHDSLLQLLAIFILAAISFKHFGELKKIAFWIVYGFITFLPWIILRTPENLHLCQLLFLRSTLLYLSLMLLATHIPVNTLHRHLSRLAGEYVATLLSLSLHFAPMVRHLIIKNYGVYYFKSCRIYPRWKQLLSYTLVIFKQMISAADNCAENMIMAHQNTSPHCIIITGPKHSGKTTRLLALIAEYQTKGWPISGIVAPSTMQEGRRTSIYLKNIKTEKQQLFASRDIPIQDSFHEYGGFRFSQATYQFANHALLDYTPGGIVALDEYGPLELAGLGFANAFTNLLSAPISALIVVVRQEMLDQWLTKFSPKSHAIIEVGKTLDQRELNQAPILSQS